MKNLGRRKKVAITILVIFLAAQAVRPHKNRGNQSGTNDVTKVVAISDSVQTILKRSCYDCHSNDTNYPWYDEITPVNWWVANHIEEGKRTLNFSAFADYRPKKMAHKLESIAKTVDKNQMPLPSYLWMHHDAKLSEAEKQLIISWAQKAEQKISVH